VLDLAKAFPRQIEIKWFRLHATMHNRLPFGNRSARPI